MTMLPPFERIVAAHGATVLRVCRAVLGSSDEAEDAWSETFLAALRAYPRLEPDANVQAWLVTIAHRKALDVVRARRRHAVPVGTLPERPAGGRSPESAIDDGHAWDLVRALPERQRLAVAYHHLGGLPYAEVAALIGGTPEAARRAAADGIARLRRDRALPAGG
jgi:RNA polymerase sigma factor (sigma-70 family)